MTQPVIDESKCLHDDLCAKTCPVGVLRPQTSGTARFAEDATCVACGHCVSVCPRAAISLDSVPPETLEPLPEGGRVDPEQARRLLKGRRSIRIYRKDPLPRDVITEMLATAEYAPAGTNNRFLGWSVIYEREAVEAIAKATAAWMKKAIAEGSPYVKPLYLPVMMKHWDAGEDVVCRRAPHLIVAHAPEAIPSGPTAGAISITYLELAARGMGVGACWAGYVYLAASMSAEVRALSRVPAGHRCVGAALVGYPGVTYLRVPARRRPEITWAVR